MSGRLNLFQAMMVRWRALHPYNAVHVVRVNQPLDRGRLEREINDELRELGLTGFVLERDRQRFRFEGGPAGVVLRVTACGEYPENVLRSEMEAELNASFAVEGPMHPFRFFAVDGGGSFDLGLAYDHFLAGGDSIAVVLGSIVDRYLGGVTADRIARPLDVYPETFVRLFLQQATTVLRGVLSLPRIMSSCRRSFRPPAAAADDDANGFVHFRGEEGELAALIQTGKEWGVTLNDIFLAAALLALSPLAAARTKAPRRRELAVASVVNIRPELQPEPRRTFGQCLASFRVSHLVPEGINLRKLAQDIHVETDRIKRSKLYLVTLLAIGLAGLLWPRLSDRQRRGFFFKHYPVWAGVTMLNINAYWTRPGIANPPIEYLRTASTGPLSPIVFALTTAGDALQVGISYRRSAFSRRTIEDLAARFRSSYRGALQ
ncbi:MAG: hypothetical protein AMJ67_10575 [Betaproteobacteria bacterium SG8_41]|jgi:hypothetical protein|nr:MAG: hypothetical protein AMJ67_10575 [Betaproteobacteria bacterium SG8_41]